MCIEKGHGTYDVFGDEAYKWQYIENTIKNICKLYNYKYIRTPIFERTELFHKSIGHATDVISKELYQFKDKENLDISLRPEGTSGVVRSYIENEIDKNNISKFYYMGPMFRYEKIENGRFREFHQFGIEVINSNDPMIDVEVITLAINIFKKLGLNDIKLYINNVGSYEDKKKYKKALKNYFIEHIDNLCDDCKRRYEKNPIRILDCKLDKRTELVLNAPKIEDYISENSKKRFDRVIELLIDQKIDYVINKNLVRGLDYYTDTVFEIKTNIDDLGTANTICGGGRYNSLIEYLSNKNVPAIGFSIGLERLMNILDIKSLLDNKLETKVDFSIKINNDNNEKYILSLAHTLRNLGYTVDVTNNTYNSINSISIIDEKTLILNNKKISYNKLFKKFKRKSDSEITNN